MESLEGLPYKNETIPLVELQRLQHVNSLLSTAIERYEDEIESLETTFGKNGENNARAFAEAKSKVEQNILSDLMTTLDRLDVWSYKFSTESQGTGENLTETPDDSVYYMTASGALLRLKMSNRAEGRNKGIKKVIQPIMEKIFFEKIGEGISETPQIGYHVVEYATQDFFDKLTEDSVKGDYQSPIRKYEHDGRTELPKLDNIKYSHEGSPVNNLDF